jgi:hypothetical protein
MDGQELARHVEDFLVVSTLESAIHDIYSLLPNGAHNHDRNNCLQVLLGNAGLIKDRYDGQSASFTFAVLRQLNPSYYEDALMSLKKAIDECRIAV